MRTLLTFKKGTSQKVRNKFAIELYKISGWDWEAVPGGIMVSHKKKDMRIVWLFMLSKIFSDIKGSK